MMTNFVPKSIKNYIKLNSKTLIQDLESNLVMLSITEKEVTSKLTVHGDLPRRNVRNLRCFSLPKIKNMFLVYWKFDSQNFMVIWFHPFIFLSSISNFPSSIKNSGLFTNLGLNLGIKCSSALNWKKKIFHTPSPKIN